MRSNCILSLTMSGHGFSGALCKDGIIVAATSLERLTRVKYDILLPISKADLKTFGWNMPPQFYQDNVDLPFDIVNDYTEVDFDKLDKFHLLLNYLLEAGNVDLKEVDTVVYSYRYTESVKQFFTKRNPNITFIVPEHHFSHACQAYLPSPFQEAAIMVIDGQGVPLERTGYDQMSGCLAYGKGNSIETLAEFPVRYSLGGMYADFTRKVGFATNEEGKTMGLAPYGTPKYYDILKKDLRFDTKEYNLRDFKKLIKRGLRPQEYLYSLGKYQSFLESFKRRGKKEEFTDIYKDLAYAVQKLTEDVMIYLANWLQKTTGSDNLCIAGGVGLNCVANYQVLAHSNFKNVFVHPNAGDNGLAVGQALYAYNIVSGNQRKYVATHDYLGKAYSSDEVGKVVERFRTDPNIAITEFKDMDQLYETMASHIEAGKITSWYQGRSEFGPRALGNRSIIADPRRKDMKDILNSRVKFREGFRPFTPSVLKERASEFFTIDVESPFMLLAPFVKSGKAELVPAITHADNTARVQTVSRDVNERYYDLIKAFEKRTGIPMILNTSFNVAGEPIVETPEDAIKCFLSTDIDVLGIDNFFLSKKKE